MSSPTLVDIRARRVNESAIEMLREMLAAAESGDVIGFSGVAVGPEGIVFDGWSAGEYNKYIMIGAMEALKRDYLALEIEQR